MIPSLRSTTANYGTFPKLNECIAFVPSSKSGGSTKSSVYLSTTNISPLLKNKSTKSSLDDAANLTCCTDVPFYLDAISSVSCMCFASFLV
jgi:hypothetical protein